MFRRIGNTLLLVTLLAGMTWTGMALDPEPARAYHSYEERLLNTTAYSLHRRRVRLGLMQLSYGIIDQLQVTTYTMPWILGAIFQDVAPNVELKSTFFDRRRLALSASIGFLTGTVAQSDDSKVRYFLLPIALASSVRINSDVSVHLGTRFTAVTGGTDAQAGDDPVAGAAVVDFLQLWGMAEWRLSRVVAFTFTVRWVPYVSDVVVNGSLGGNPSADLQLQAAVDDLRNAFAIIPGFVFSWDHANIRLGVGYSDFFVDGFYLIIPGDVLSNVAPEFDIFVRF